MEDDVRFDVFGNLWHFLKNERHQLNERHNIKGLRNLYNDYVVLFDSGAICLLKHCQKCKEVKGENQEKNV